MSIPVSMQYFVYRKFMQHALYDDYVAITNLTDEFSNGRSVANSVALVEYMDNPENRHTPLDEWLTPTEFFGRG